MFVLETDFLDFHIIHFGTFRGLFQNSMTNQLFYAICVPHRGGSNLAQQGSSETQNFATDKAAPVTITHYLERTVGNNKEY